MVEGFFIDGGTICTFLHNSKQNLTIFANNFIESMFATGLAVNVSHLAESGTAGLLRRLLSNVNQELRDRLRTITAPVAAISRDKTTTPHSFNVGIGAGIVTVRASVAVPLFPEEEVRLPVVFVYVSAVEDVTSTRIVQVVPAATVPPVYVITLVPGTAVSVPPVQVVEALAGVATVTPAGRLSVKSMSVAAKELAVLSMVNVSVLTPPQVME